MTGQCATDDLDTLDLEAVDLQIGDFENFTLWLLPEELAALAEAAVEIGCIDIAEDLIAAAYDRLDGFPPQSVAVCLERLRQATCESDRTSVVVGRIRSLLSSS